MALTYSKYKGYSLHPAKETYVAKNFNAFSTLRRIDYAEDTGRLASQINEVLELNLPIHVVEDIWEDYSLGMCAQFMCIGDNAEANVRCVIEQTDWFVEDVPPPQEPVYQKMAAKPKDELYKTFGDWKKEGRAVMIGERSHKRNDDGVAVFSLNQTTSLTEENGSHESEMIVNYNNWDNPDMRRNITLGYSNEGDDAMPEDGRFYEWDQEY